MTPINDPQGSGLLRISFLVHCVSRQGLAAALVLVLSLLGVAPVHAGATTAIFVLHSYSQEYPWTKRQHEGFLRKLGSATPDAIDASVEYLDTKRVPYTPAYAAIVAAHIERKYAGFEPKFIYVTDDNALSFALSHLARIFPKAPIFFSGINDFDMKQRIDPARVTGVFEKKEIAPNLELMRHLAPGVRDILVVGDASETYQAVRREILGELAHQPDIQAHFLSDARIEKLTASLQGRKEQFVFLTTLGAMKDAAGRTLTLPETIAAILSVGKFIVISMEDVYLYPGVLGGYVTSGYRQGAAAAELSARYLAHTAVAAIQPIEASPNEYIIDGIELEKLGLKLPAELVGRTTIVNQPPTFYARNLTPIVYSLYALTLLFFASLAASIYTLKRKNRQIARSSKALAAQAEQLRTVVERFPVVLWVVDREGIFTLSRGAGLKALGLAPDEVVGKSLFEIYRDFPAIIANTKRALAGESHVSSTWVGALAFETHYSPLRDASGAVIGATGVSTDVTERKKAETEIRQINIELEHRVEQRTHELQVANGELESFAYSVSHDLRAPLRAIEGFSRLIESEYAALFDDRAKDYFRRIRGGATRMGTLIDDLLNLSRISRQAMRRETVDLSALAREVAQELQGAEPGRNVQWLIEPQVRVDADPGLLRVVLQNLLGNAWKYSSKRAAARIEFGVSERDGRTAYFVRDNGEGFDMAYADKLFGAFQRLHSAGEFPGTGIGLATVKRIIHRHNGDIGAQGKVGEGATFYFTL